MERRPRKFTFRLSHDEYKYLETVAKENKYKNISSFARENLLEKSGHSSAELKRQLNRLEWEINKIGTNINQVTKKINSDFNVRASDIQDLLSSQERIITLIEEYEKKVQDTWQLQN